MPSNWLTIDDSFPSFTGEESPTQQIRALHDYLFQLREGLRYSLQNLSADNFNASALQNLTDSQKNEVTKELEKVYVLLSDVASSVENLSARVSGAENVSGRVTELEKTVSGVGGLGEKVAAIEKAVTEEGGLTDRVAGLEKTITEEGGLTDRVVEIEKTVTEDGGLADRIDAAEKTLVDITGTMTVNEDGNAAVGAEGKRLDLIGEIYINGVLFTQGGDT